jgi:hypothetical protein
MIFICKSSRQHNHHDGRDRSSNVMSDDDGAMARASRNTFLSRQKNDSYKTHSDIKYSRMKIEHLNNMFSSLECVVWMIES